MTVTWQAAAVALLAAGIGVGFLPIGSMLGPGKQAAVRDAEGPPAPPKPTSMGAGAVLNLAGNLKRLAGEREIPPPVAPPPPPEDTGPSEPPAPPPPEVSESHWTYVGHMIGPAFKRAVVQIGPAGAGTPQLSLGEGDTREGVKLLKIAPDHIMVDPGDGNEKRIDLAARSPSTSWNTDAPRRPMAGRGLPGAAGMPGSMAAPAGFTSPNAAALAEAQRRMKAAISPPPMMQSPEDERAQKLAEMAKEMGELAQDKREALQKIMSDPSMNPDERDNLLREIGIPVDATPEERGQFLEMIGIGPKNDPKLYEMIRENGGPRE